MKKKNLLIDEYPLMVLPSLAKTIGLNEAIVLQQLHYWLENAKGGVERNGYRWVYNTYESWKEDNFPFWSERTIQRIFLNLENDGLVIADQLDKSTYERRKYYRIDYDKLALLTVTDAPPQERQGDCADDDKLAPSLNESETTPEITTETNTDINNNLDLSLHPTTEEEIKQIRYDTIAVNFGKNFLPYLAEFYRLTEMLPDNKKQITEWIDACSGMWAARLEVQDMEQALTTLLSQGYTVKNPGSLKAVMQTIKIRREKGIVAKPKPGAPVRTNGNEHRKYLLD